MLDLSNLFSLIEEKGKSAELSKKTGISTGNISDWKTGRSKPKPEALVKIADVLDCSVDYLLGRTNFKYISTKNSNIIPIPIIRQRAAAGLGIETNDYSDIIEDIYFFDKFTVPKGTEFGIIIEGDSMETKYKDGQVIFVKKSVDCDNEQCGIFCITEHDKTVVVFKKKIMKANGSYCLRSYNEQKYKDIDDFDEIKTCRCVAKLLKK